MTTTGKLSERITPGKWQWYWSKGANDETDCGVFAGGGLARSICRAPRYETKEQWEANAEAIALVPDLLRVSEAMAEALRSVSGTGHKVDIAINGHIPSVCPKCISEAALAEWEKLRK